MFVGNHVPADDPRMEKMYSHFRENLGDICEAARKSGARVILCTVASNLGDCAPFGSAHRSNLSGAETAAWEETYNAGVALEAKGDCAQAAAKYQEAARLDDHFADLHFRLGRCCRELKEFDKGREELILARDQDVLRFRADTRINRIIRDTAAGQESNGIHLLDLVRIFEEEDKAAHGAPGDDLFWDHVHMNFAGNYLLASVPRRRTGSEPCRLLNRGPPRGDGFAAADGKVRGGPCIDRLEAGSGRSLAVAAGKQPALHVSTQP